MRSVCPECNGRWDPDNVCPTCEGVGAVERCIVHLIAYPSGQECPTCGAYIAGGL